MSEKTAVGEILDAMGKTASNIITFGLVVAAGGTLGWMRLRQFYDTEDLIGFGVVAVAVVVGGKVVATRILPGAWRSIKNIPWGQLREKLRRQQIEEETDSWFSRFTAAYRPVRSSLGLPVGVDEHRQFVEVSMNGPESHLLVTGITGTGKSVLVNQILVAAGMSGRYQVAIAALSGKDYRLIANEMANIHLQTYIDGRADPKAAMEQWAAVLPDILNSFNQEVVRRQRLLTQHEVRQMSDLPAAVRPPETILLIEEFTNALNHVEEAGGRKARAEITGRVASAVQFGRASGMHLILIGQRPTGNIPNSIKKQMVYLSLRVADAQEAFWSTNRQKSGAEQLRVVDVERGIPGEALVVGALSGMRKVTVPLTSDIDLRLAAGAFADRVPVLPPPTWLTAVTSVTASPVTTPRNSQETEDFTPPSQRATPVTVTAVTPLRAATVAASAPPLRVSMPVPPSTKEKRPFTPELVRIAAAHLFEKHKDFQGLGEAFTKDRTILAFLCLASGMSRAATSTAVFGGRNARYYEFLNLCQKHLDRARTIYQAH